MTVFHAGRSRLFITSRWRLGPPPGTHISRQIIENCLKTATPIAPKPFSHPAAIARRAFTQGTATPLLYLKLAAEIGWRRPGYRVQAVDADMVDPNPCQGVRGLLIPNPPPRPRSSRRHVPAHAVRARADSGWVVHRRCHKASDELPVHRGGDPASVRPYRRYDLRWGRGVAHAACQTGRLSKGPGCPSQR